jgi:hypothetical protein
MSPNVMVSRKVRSGASVILMDSTSPSAIRTARKPDGPMVGSLVISFPPSAADLPEIIGHQINGLRQERLRASNTYA